MPTTTDPDDLNPRLPTQPGPIRMTRRVFLTGAAGVGTSVLLGACSSDPTNSGAPTSATASLPAIAPAPPGTASGSAAKGTLVLITLAGGNDSLNTVIPINDPLYAQLRASMAIDPAAALRIDDDFALHPSLERTAALWSAQKVAAVHGVGFDGLDRSHFHCMDVWQAGNTDDLGTGWVGRWLDQHGSSPMDALGIGRGMPLLLRGENRSAAVVQPAAFALPGGPRLTQLVETLAATDPGRSPLAAKIAGSSSDLLTVFETVAPILATPDNGADPAPAPPSSYGGDTTLTEQLQAVAKLMASDLPTRVFHVELGGFDTHTDQLATQATLLRQLDGAVGSFFDTVGDADVTVAIYSEFGRRVRPNNLGTDHGAGGTVLVLGNVRAGHHGDPPPLDRLDQGDLTFTTDFRSVFGGLIEGVIGADPADLVGTRHPPLTLV